MSLISLAIINRGNEPIYARDFTDYITPEIVPFDDPFDLFDTNTSASSSSPSPSATKTKVSSSASIRHNFIYSMALERFQEVLQSTQKIRGSSHDNPLWIGLILPIDELRVYGYITNSNVKLMAIVVDSYLFSIQQIQRESELKSFFSSLHTLYVDYTMNPFNAMKKSFVIDSRFFDDAVARIVQIFNSQG